jgi:hypothetical protein
MPILSPDLTIWIGMIVSPGISCLKELNNRHKRLLKSGYLALFPP